MKENKLQLEDLKVSNLPELQGWKDKQEKLVDENPYIEIIDSKTYGVACASRTALLKGRTELEKQDKLIASKLANFRKDVKLETDNLIAITLPHEEKQQNEVKRYDGIKEAEKVERDRIESMRIEKIKLKIEEIESSCYTIINQATFSTNKIVGTQLFAFFTIEFDFEEFDILWEGAKNRIQSQWDVKLADIKEKEDQRLENEKLEKEIKDAKVKSDLQSSRLNEMLPYIAFGDIVDLPNLFAIEENTYSEILASKKALFEADSKNKKEANDKLEIENKEKEAKEKIEKGTIFEIRKNRLLEIGFVLTEEDVFRHPDLSSAIVQCYSRNTIYETDAIAFENVISESKNDIEKAKLELEELGKQKAKDLKIAKLDAIKLTAENKARVKKYANDKKSLLEFANSLEFRNPVPELKNEDLQPSLDQLLEVLNSVKSDFTNTLNQF